MTNILVIHGPNLDLLGKREPEVYGRVTLEEIDNALKSSAKRQRVKLTIIQSNHEGDIVSVIGRAKGKFQAVVINPAAYTHTSVAIRDAILASGVPTVEIHLSNIYAREQFRRKSLISPVVQGGIYGFGAESYILGLNAAISLAKRYARKKK
ncbi:MAG: type II 3-dehydroquinate dehydratase [Candidatus Omnitrophota bacterium]